MERLRLLGWVERLPLCGQRSDPISGSPTKLAARRGPGAGNRANDPATGVAHGTDVSRRARSRFHPRHPGPRGHCFHPDGLKSSALPHAFNAHAPEATSIPQGNAYSVGAQATRLTRTDSTRENQIHNERRSAPLPSPKKLRARHIHQAISCAIRAFQQAQHSARSKPTALEARSSPLLAMRAAPAPNRCGISRNLPSAISYRGHDPALMARSRPLLKHALLGVHPVTRPASLRPLISTLDRTTLTTDSDHPPEPAGFTAPLFWGIYPPAHVPQ